MKDIQNYDLLQNNKTKDLYSSILKGIIIYYKIILII